MCREGAWAQGYSKVASMLSSFCIDDDEREEKLGLVLLSKLLKKNDDLTHVYEEYPVRNVIVMCMTDSLN